MTTKIDFHVRGDDGEPAIAVSLTALSEDNEGLLEGVADAIVEVEDAG